tara:strand:+ start:183 stop:1265 length:1083 start_codon:yes stop_codon:yes gene_type:complete
MDIKTFTNVASKLPPHIAVLMRGPTGVGKSHLARQCADELELPFIDVRLSTMSEGDFGGYPDIEGMKETQIMTFCMPSWFVRACQEPCVVMLDEANRALPGVLQGAFQLVLDRELGNDKDGNPYRLHPETRIFCAINHGAEYDVNDMDPALLRRFWVTDLEPSTEDWLTWATDAGLDSVLIDFIRQNPVHLRVDPSEVEPGTVCPNPASWHRVNDSLVHMGMAPTAFAGKERPEGFYAVCLGMLGVEASIAFSEFVEKYELVLSAEDVLDDWKESKDKVKNLGAEGQGALIVKLGNHFADNEWTTKQAKNAAAFAGTLGDELLVHFWNQCVATQKVPNIQKLHKLLGQRVVEAVKASREV